MPAHTFQGRRGNLWEILNIWKLNNSYWLQVFILIFAQEIFVYLQIEPISQIFVETITDIKDQTSLWYMVLISATISWILHFAFTSQLLWHRKKYWSEFKKKKILEYASKVLAVFQMSKHNKTYFVYTASVLEIRNPQNLCLIVSKWRKAVTDPLVYSFTCT